MNLTEEIQKILTEDLIIHGCTHENAPPNHDCGEECSVSVEDQIAASNPICSPVRSEGKKHRKCMDCWNEYVNSLTKKNIALFNQWLEEQGAEVETRNPNWAQGVHYSDKFIHVPLRII